MYRFFNDECNFVYFLSYDPKTEKVNISKRAWNYLKFLNTIEMDKTNVQKFF